jgi:hypothetical protein
MVKIEMKQHRFRPPYIKSRGEPGARIEGTLQEHSFTFKQA